MALFVVHVTESKVKLEIKRTALLEDPEYMADLKMSFINAHNEKINRIKKPAVGAAG